MKKALAVPATALILTLTACDAFRAIAPQTAAGWDSGGVAGAITGASHAIVATCKTIDGQAIQVVVDDVSEVTGAGDLVERVRAARKRACATATTIITSVADGREEPID